MQLKIYIYSRDKDAGGFGTIAIVVDEFDDGFKARAGQAYLSRFELTPDMDASTRLERDFQFQALLNVPEDFGGRYGVDIMEHGYWIVDSGSPVPANALREFDVVASRPQYPQGAGQVWSFLDWGGFTLVLCPKQQTPQEMVAQAIADGKHVFCALPVAIGSVVLILHNDTLVAVEIGMGSNEEGNVYETFKKIEAAITANTNTR